MAHAMVVVEVLEAGEAWKELHTGEEIREEGGEAEDEVEHPVQTHHTVLAGMEVLLLLPLQTRWQRHQ